MTKICMTLFAFFLLAQSPMAEAKVFRFEESYNLDNLLYGFENASISLPGLDDPGARVISVDLYVEIYTRLRADYGYTLSPPPAGSLSYRDFSSDTTVVSIELESDRFSKTLFERDRTGSFPRNGLVNTLDLAVANDREFVGSGDTLCDPLACEGSVTSDNSGDLRYIENHPGYSEDLVRGGVNMIARITYDSDTVGYGSDSDGYISVTEGASGYVRVAGRYVYAPASPSQVPLPASSLALLAAMLGLFGMGVLRPHGSGSRRAAA